MAMTYQGPATLVAPGLGITVVADLRVEWQTFETVDGNGWVVRARGLKGWLGAVETDPDESFWELLGKSVKLRLPNGREGTIIPVGGTHGSGRLEIHGRGPAPFWDQADEPTS